MARPSALLILALLIPRDVPVVWRFSCLWRFSVFCFVLLLLSFQQRPPLPPDEGLLATDCSSNHGADLIGNSLPGFKGKYLQIFDALLAKEFLQPCVVAGAVEALMGDGGVLAAAMDRDVTHWRQQSGCCRSWNRHTQVTFFKAWVNGRLRHLQQAVASGLAGCARDPCLQQPGANCPASCAPARTSAAPCALLSHDEQARLCAAAGIDPSLPTLCVQGSLEPSCVVDPDPCASSPCQHGGVCRTGVVAVAAGAPDACGCVAPEGWSKSAGGGGGGCVVDSRTSRPEAEACATIAGTTARWLEFGCECAATGYSGLTCEQQSAAAAGPDECGCMAGTGWSKHGAACTAGGTTAASEAVDCAAAGSGPPSPSSGGSDRVGCVPQRPGSTDCSVAGLGPLTDTYCPAAGDFCARPTHAGECVVPESCPVACAVPFVGWWQACASNSGVAAFDFLVDGQLSDFSSRCAAVLQTGCSSGRVPGPGGH